MLAAVEARGDERLLGNKGDLAKVLKCSLPTLAKLIDEYGDRFPIEHRGSNGVEWEFDIVAVCKFLEAEKAREVAIEKERRERFAQFSLPIDDAAGGGSTEMTNTQRLSLARARLLERKLAVESGMLVSKAEMRQIMAGMLSRLGRFFDNLPTNVARRFGLPDEIARAMRSMLDEERRRFVKEWQEALGDQPGTAEIE